MRMRELLVEMERDGHTKAVAQGWELVASCERSLAMMYDCRTFWGSVA